MRPPLAPIETRPAQQAAGAFSPPRRERRGVDADRCKKSDARLCHQAGIAVELDIAAADHGIGERDAEPTGKMIVTSSRGSQRGIARADAQPPAWRRAIRRHLHDAFHHLRHRARSEPVIAMPSLLLGQEQAEFRHSGQVAACGLRADCGGACQFRRGQRAAVEQRMKHGGAGGIAGKRGDLGEFGGAGHRLDLVERRDVTRETGAMLRCSP